MPFDSALGINIPGIRASSHANWRMGDGGGGVLFCRDQFTVYLILLF